MRMPLLNRWSLCALFAVLLVAQVATAQQKPEPPKKRVIRLDEISVEGRIQKPQAFYILPRSNLNYEALDRKESFLPKIIRTFEKDPF